MYGDAACVGGGKGFGGWAGWNCKLYCYFEGDVLILQYKNNDKKQT